MERGDVVMVATAKKGRDGLNQDIDELELDQIEGEEIPEELPVLKRLSWGSAKRFTAFQWRIRTLDGNPDALLALWMEIQAEMAKVVVSVPRSWVVEDAPKNLDWSKAESFEWVDSDRMTALLALAAGDREKKAPRS